MLKWRPKLFRSAFSEDLPSTSSLPQHHSRQGIYYNVINRFCVKFTFAKMLRFWRIGQRIHGNALICFKKRIGIVCEQPNS